MTTNPAPSDVSTFALYIHWPWCLAKCPYCDFNSRAARPDIAMQAAYKAAILAEINHYENASNASRLSSIYFGGGTPSLMDPDSVAQIIATATGLWSPTPDLEITIEANPTSIEAAKFRAFRDAGVNRVSVGVQALNDTDLQRLGREHSADEARRAVEIAAGAFDRYTFDLIYARPGQGMGDWEDELTQALALADGHISLYQLTVEPGTDYFRQRVAQAPEDLAADLYQLTQDMTIDAGLPAYEISNHAQPGGQSRHNLTYWRGLDYIGVGPGAHGRITSPNGHAATHQIADPDRWLNAVTRQGHGTAKTRRITAHDRAIELLLAGLRLDEGIDRARFSYITQCDVLDIIDAHGLDVVIGEGLAAITDSRLYIQPKGRLMLNAILDKLLA